MAKPETTFYTSVHKHLPPLSELHREKMHNPYRGGTADHWFSGCKADLWVEYKFIVVPKRDDTMIDLVGGNKPIISVLQQDWLTERHNEGRNVWVIVGCKEGGVVFRGREWGGAFDAGSFRLRIKDRKDIANQIKVFTLGR